MRRHEVRLQYNMGGGEHAAFYLAPKAALIHSQNYTGHFDRESKKEARSQNLRASNAISVTTRKPHH